MKRKINENQTVLFTKENFTSNEQARLLVKDYFMKHGKELIEVMGLQGFILAKKFIDDL